tara:strand:+ start:45397 stop:45933 length:537 start_codon:yes stop_codon:yes gene_type:complete
MLLFNGSLHPVTDRSGSFYAKVYHAVLDQCEELGIPVTQVDLSQTNLPFLDPFNIEKNEAVDEFLKTFTEEEKQIWISPLYHGTITGVMKNALDWLELTSRNDAPYLSGKTVGLISTAEGSFGVQGINTMISIAHTLRASVLPYSIPVNKQEAILRDPNELTEHYQNKIKLMLELLKE